MTPEEFRAAGHQAVDWIADYLSQVGELPVTPAIDAAGVRPGWLIDRLPKAAPEEGEPFEAIFRDFREQIVPGMTHWNHPRFLAYFAISGSGPGILGEMLAAALNVNHMLWKTGPAATELEQVTLGWLRQWLGLPDGFFGIIHDTASTATLHAVLAARELAAPDARRSGESPKLVLYCSEHAHSSVDKAALAAGTGLDRVRHVPSDDQFRMRPEALATMIAEDRARGQTPFCVVATVGTTSSGSVDPLREIARVSKEAGLWLHVDAAYAGPAAMLEEYRHILDGAAEADSLVANPHKWLFTPVDLSALYTRRPEAMRRAVSLDDAPPYLTASDQQRAVNLADYSLALGRRFRSLKLWFVLRSYGRKGIEEVLRRHIEIAREAAGWIAADDRFELTAPPAFSLLCFRYRRFGADLVKDEADEMDRANRELLERINATGEAYLSGTQLNGRFVLRMAIGNVATTRADVARVWRLIQDLAPSIS